MKNVASDQAAPRMPATMRSTMWPRPPDHLEQRADGGGDERPEENRPGAPYGGRQRRADRRCAAVQPFGGPGNYGGVKKMPTK